MAGIELAREKKRMSQLPTNLCCISQASFKYLWKLIGERGLEFGNKTKPPIRGDL